jgi:hypothetical protein
MFGYVADLDEIYYSNHIGNPNQYRDFGNYFLMIFDYIRNIILMKNNYFLFFT